MTGICQVGSKSEAIQENRKETRVLAMHHVHAHVQCKPALRAKQGGAPLRLWASELRRTSTTTTTTLAIVVAAVQLQPTMATESGETPRRMLINPFAHPRNTMR